MKWAGIGLLSVSASLCKSLSLIQCTRPQGDGLLRTECNMGIALCCSLTLLRLIIFWSHFLTLLRLSIYWSLTVPSWGLSFATRKNTRVFLSSLNLLLSRVRVLPKWLNLCPLWLVFNAFQWHHCWTPSKYFNKNDFPHVVSLWDIKENYLLFWWLPNGAIEMPC